MNAAMRFLPLVLPFLLAGCVQPPAPSAVPDKRPVAAAPAPPPAAAVSIAENWQDWPITLGDWAYRRDARGSVALFGPVAQNALFVVRCEMTPRRILLSRAGAFAGSETGQITLRGTSALKTYPVSNVRADPDYVVAALTTSDPQLDILTYSRGRFLVSVKGSPDLVIPAWPEVARVIEDCRS